MASSLRLFDYCRTNTMWDYSYNALMVSDQIPQSELWTPIPKVPYIKCGYDVMRYFKIFTGIKFAVGGSKK